MQTLTDRAKSFLEPRQTSCATAKSEQQVIHLIGKLLLVGVVFVMLMSLKDIARYIRIKSM